MRIKSKWHDNSQKTLQKMASTVSFSSWRLTKNQLEDLINFPLLKDKNLSQQLLNNEAVEL